MTTTAPPDTATTDVPGAAVADPPPTIGPPGSAGTSAPPAGGAPGQAASQAPVTRNGLRAVVVTTAICAIAALAGHLVLLGGWLGRGAGSTTNLVPWQPVVGASLSVVAVVAFGGFYHASLRARVAIMGSFLLTFLLLLTFVLTVRELDGSSPVQIELLGDFRVIVQTIIGFYFGTETALSMAKIIRAPRDDAAAIRRADRDLPAG